MNPLELVGFQMTQEAVVMEWAEEPSHFPLSFVLIAAIMLNDWALIAVGKIQRLCLTLFGCKRVDVKLRKECWNAQDTHPFEVDEAATWFNKASNVDGIESLDAVEGCEMTACAGGVVLAEGPSLLARGSEKGTEFTLSGSITKQTKHCFS
jgi:hypothetical protein